jgi:hypothetical protein
MQGQEPRVYKAKAKLDRNRLEEGRGVGARGGFLGCVALDDAVSLGSRALLVLEALRRYLDFGDWGPQTGKGSGPQC